MAIATGLFISVEKPGIEKSRQFPAGIITLPQYQWSGQQDLNLTQAIDFIKSGSDNEPEGEPIPAKDCVAT
ncbi:MAG TPA: hypothetical protein VKE53_12790 [Pseudolabrys sp.]|nr:hypothetical protein [Pseudolabrys sp.]